MADGVDLLQIRVTDVDQGKITVEIVLVISSDNEFEAVGWLVEKLGEE